MIPSLDYESIGYEERIRRIGAILAKAVILRLERECAEREGTGGASSEPEETRPSGPGPSAPDRPADPLADDDLTLMRLAAIVGYFHPREAVEFWGVSRTTAYRRLHRLEQDGWIVRHGQGKASRYHLTGKTHSALKRMKRSMRNGGVERSAP